jgi:hypothetical protein
VSRTTRESARTDAPDPTCTTELRHHVTIDLPLALYEGVRLNTSASSVPFNIRPTCLKAAFGTDTGTDGSTHTMAWWTLEGPRVKKDGSDSDTQTGQITLRRLETSPHHTMDQSNALKIIRPLDAQITGDRSAFTPLSVEPFAEGDVLRTLHKIYD